MLRYKSELFELLIVEFIGISKVPDVNDVSFNDLV